MTSQPDPKDGPPDDVLEKIVGEALYFEYPHRVIGDVQRKVVLEAVAKIRAALRVVPPEGGPRADGCPCTLIEPCTSACSCADGYMSGGCLRCCKYGSPEQRLAAANDIASRLRASGAGTRQEERYR